MPRIVTLLAPGFEEIEAVAVIDLLRRAEITVETVSITKDHRVAGAHGIRLIADSTLDTLDAGSFDGIFLPGGQPGSDNLRQHGQVLELIRSFNDQKKLIAAICAAPLVLLAAGILSGRRITSYPAVGNAFEPGNYRDERVVRDGNILTSRGVGTAIDFALALIEILKDKKMRDDQAERILWK